MDASSRTSRFEFKTHIAVILVGLALTACAVKTGTFSSSEANHPASPQAEAGDIQDPGQSLVMGAAQPAGASEHSAAGDASKPAQARYVCPMHPDVLSDQPGKCPRCGMALEPTKPAASGEHVHDH